MTELETIQNIPFPRTRETLAADLRALGLQSGMVVIVHSSLSSIGWVNGGSMAVVQALLDVITPDGTLVMPAHSGELLRSVTLAASTRARSMVANHPRHDACLRSARHAHARHGPHR